MRRRVLFVARTRYRLPLEPGLAAKWRALEQRLDVRVLAAAAGGSTGTDPAFALVRPLGPPAVDGPLFYLLLPFRVARQLRRFRPDAVVAQAPYEGAAVVLARRLARFPVPLVVEVQGDWRTFTRLYGGRARRVLDPLADALADWVVRRADAVRALSGYTASLARAQGVEPVGVFPPFMDFAAFLEHPPKPLPTRPGALFVGVLERYKNIDGLVDAWREVARRLPDARLWIVGAGRLTEPVERLVSELPETVTWSPALSAPEIARALDESTLLVLPSRSEGMGRVLAEAFCRGRPVVGSRVGGIPDLVEHDVNGLLVDPGNNGALADALERVLSDRTLAERLADGALRSAPAWILSPEGFAERQAEVIERAVAAR